MGFKVDVNYHTMVQTNTLHCEVHGCNTEWSIEESLTIACVPMLTVRRFTEMGWTFNYRVRLGWCCPMCDAAWPARVAMMGKDHYVQPLTCTTLEEE